MILSKFESLILYCIVFLLSVLLFYIFTKKISRFSYFGLLLSALLPSLLSGFRDNVGTDFSTYETIIGFFRYNSWDSVFNFDVFSNIEIGFRIVIKLLSFLGSNGFVFGTLSFFTLYIFLFTLVQSNEKQNLTMIYIIYIFCFFPTSFNAVRQYLAASLVFAASQYILKKDLKKFLILCIIASSIHISALIILPMYFLWDAKNNSIRKPYAVLILSLSTVFSLFYTFLLPYFSTFFPFLNKYLYLGVLGYNTNRDIYVKILVLFIAIIFRNKLKQIDKRTSFFSVLYAIAVIVGFTGFRNPYLKRISIYFSINESTVLGTIPNTYKSYKERLFIKILIIILSVSYFILVFYIIGDSNLFPFVFRG